MRGVPDLTSAVSLNWPGDPKRYRWVMVLGAGQGARLLLRGSPANAARIAGQCCADRRPMLRGSWIAALGSRLLDRRPMAAALGSRLLNREACINRRGLLSKGRFGVDRGSIGVEWPVRA